MVYRVVWSYPIKHRIGIHTFMLTKGVLAVRGWKFTVVITSIAAVTVTALENMKISVFVGFATVGASPVGVAGGGTETIVAAGARISVCG